LNLLINTISKLESIFTNPIVGVIAYDRVFSIYRFSRTFYKEGTYYNTKKDMKLFWGSEYDHRK